MKSETWLERALYLWPVKILSIAGAILLYFFTNFLALETRPVSVPIHYVLPVGFIQGDVYPTSARIMLRGIHNDIFDISENDLQVSADLSQHSMEGVFKAELKVRRLGAVADIDPLEVSAQPSSVTVSLEKIAYKDVPIELKFSGSPKPGYEMVAQTINVTTVRVGGPRSRLANIQSVVTDDIDLSVHSEDFVQPVHLRSLDPLIKILSDDTIEFRATIRESLGIGIFKGVPITVIGLESGLTVSQKIPEGSIKVQAPQGVLQQLQTDQLRMIIDASDIKTSGTYTVKVIPELPNRVLLIQYEPSTLQLKVDVTTQERNPP